MSESPELGRRALARAEMMRSPRAAEVLRRAIAVVEERTQWESSDGQVRALDVRLLLDGYACGLMVTFPSVSDAVVEAISAAAPEALGASVIDLSFEWALRERGADAYRDRPRASVDRSSAEDVRRAVAAFFAASGDEDTAREVERARFRWRDDRLEVQGIDRARIQIALAIFSVP